MLSRSHKIKKNVLSVQETRAHLVSTSLLAALIQHNITFPLDTNAFIHNLGGSRCLTGNQTL